GKSRRRLSGTSIEQRRLFASHYEWRDTMTSSGSGRSVTWSLSCAVLDVDATAGELPGGSVPVVERARCGSRDACAEPAAPVPPARAPARQPRLARLL